MAEPSKESGVSIFQRALYAYRDRYGGSSHYGTPGIGRYEAIQGLSGRPGLDQRDRILQTSPRPAATEGRSAGSKSHRASSTPPKS